MSTLDWVVMIGATLFIVAYGIWKSRGAKDIRGYLLANKSMKWWTIGLSIMATQASAITFLSTPGQGFDSGMGFVQFYFGLPIAAVILCIVAIPIYHKLNVYTAYEYLEKRFDFKTRSVAAILFLIQRGLAAGFTIYAPALILSTVLPWDTTWACVVIGTIVTIYTVSGGTEAVSQTQKLQMGIILVGMVVAGVMLVTKLPEDISFGNALDIAGKMGKLEVIDLEFDPTSRYNIWSGILASTFLMLSYFGTDQSQVQRYLGGKSIAESRIGLLVNGMVKVPMQFLILLVGVLLFVFYQFEQPPLHFNKDEQKVVIAGQFSDDFKKLEHQYDSLHAARKRTILSLDGALKAENPGQINDLQTKAQNLDQGIQGLRKESKLLIAKSQMVIAGEDISPYEEAEAILTQFPTDSAKVAKAKATLKELEGRTKTDSDRIFLTFILDYLPSGLVGLLIAMILAASMSSTSSELNALGTTTVIDIYKRAVKKDGSDKHYLFASRGFTVVWGVYAIGFSLFADQLENLIQAVNILGSLVYGTILGIFLVAFFLKRIGGTAVFIAAILAELLILYCWWFTDLAFLWYTPVGCLAVIGFSWIIQMFTNKSHAASS